MEGSLVERCELEKRGRSETEFCRRGNLYMKESTLGHREGTACGTPRDQGALWGQFVFDVDQSLNSLSIWHIVFWTHCITA